MADVVRALFTTHVNETTQIHEGELFAADDPLVAAHPDWFSDDLLSVANRTGPAVRSKRKIETADKKLEP